MATSRAPLIAVVTTLALLMGTAGPAVAEQTAIERAVERRREAADIAKDLRKLVDERAHVLRIKTSFLDLVARKGGLEGKGWDRFIDTTRSQEQRHERAFSKLRRRIERRIGQLDRQRDGLGRWLDGLTFRVCPVPEFTSIADNFGAMVRIPKVPVHVHMGNDVAAPTGSPILAPFDGYAVSSWNHLGGMAVKVYGARGYVYNAHLSALGVLGRVRAGQVVGYVGSTGDATGPHDHIEWHPGDGPAVDPYPLMSLSCLPVSP